MAAFATARAMGADGVELDVRRTLDGALVVHHDASLGDGRAIVELSREELPPHIPTLRDALDACAGMWVNVEIKNHPQDPDFDVTEQVADATIAHLVARGEPERWLVSSFRMETVDRCRALADDAEVPIRTAWLTSRVPHGVGELLAAKGHAALHPWVDALEQRTVEECHRHHVAVNAWTCDERRRMRELIGWGVDGICTNVPDVLVEVLSRDGERGATP